MFVIRFDAYAVQNQDYDFADLQIVPASSELLKSGEKIWFHGGRKIGAVITVNGKRSDKMTYILKSRQEILTDENGIIISIKEPDENETFIQISETLNEKYTEYPYE